MLHVFRESVGRYVAIAILALIAVTFVFFLPGGSITNPIASYAAKVNGEKIPIREFEDALRDMQNQFQQLNPIELTDDLRIMLRTDTIESLVMNETILQKIRDEGYRVSNARLEEAIRGEPAFQVNGVFSEDVARSFLATRGMTPTSYRSDLHRQMQLLELQSAILDSAFITPAEFRRSIELVYERRQIAWAEFSAADFVEQVEIADEAVADYHAENASLFMTEEAVDLEFVEIDLASIADTLEISEQDLLDYYNEEGETFAGSEEREVSHIQITIGDDQDAALAEAESVLARLEAGEDFAALAMEVSDDVGSANSGGSLGWMSRGVLPAPFEDALFTLSIGELGGPIETAAGYHVLKLDGIRFSEQPPFELERDRIRGVLAEEEAYSEFYRLIDELNDAAYDAIDDLAAVAEALGLELQQAQRMTRSDASRYFQNSSSVTSIAFDDDAIVTGENSELIEFGQDIVGVIRVAAHHPPAAESLEAVSDEIRDLLRFEAAGDLAGEAAAAFTEALDVEAVVAQTQDPVALAEEHGGSWNEATWVERNVLGNVPSAILNRVLSESRPPVGTVPVFSVPIGSYDEAVVLMLDVEPGIPANIPTEEREAGQEELALQAGQIEFNAYARDARQRATVQVPDSVLNPDL